MIKKLKDILNTYSDSELEEVDLWVNGSEEIENIIIDKYNIDLITEGAEIKVNDKISKEAK